MPCDAGWVPADPYRGHRFPEEIISQCVWLYFNFCLSLRDVELMMAARGVQLSYETIRRWGDKFGQSYAAKLKRRRPEIGDKWHMDEVFLKINGVQHYLWRAVDQHGAVIDILVQPRRDRLAAIRFFRKLLRTCGRRPRVMITDKLRSYGAAKRSVMPGVAHRQHRYLNNRAENSHQPTRQRERRMKRFKSPEHAQRFLEVQGIVAAHFRPKRHLLTAAAYQAERDRRFHVWHDVRQMWTAA
jgi:putative transposase